MNNATKIENQTQTTKIKRSYIERMEGENRHSQEEFIYQAKHNVWVGYDNQDISSNVLACIISDIERMLLVSYQLGHKHGSKLGTEKGFKKALNILLKGEGNDQD